MIRIFSLKQVKEYQKYFQNSVKLSYRKVLIQIMSSSTNEMKLNISSSILDYLTIDLDVFVISIVLVEFFLGQEVMK